MCQNVCFSDITACRNDFITFVVLLLIVAPYFLSCWSWLLYISREFSDVMVALTAAESSSLKLWFPLGVYFQNKELSVYKQIVHYKVDVSINTQKDHAHQRQEVKTAQGSESLISF